jgi:hypothetical protein
MTAMSVLHSGSNVDERREAGKGGEGEGRVTGRRRAELKTKRTALCCASTSSTSSAGSAASKKPFPPFSLSSSPFRATTMANEKRASYVQAYIHCSCTTEQARRNEAEGKGKLGKSNFVQVNLCLSIVETCPPSPRETRQYLQSM